MADNTDGSPQPLSQSQPQTIAPGKNARRNKQHNKHHQQPAAQQVDGSVSDSVTNPMASPRSKKGYKQRQQSVTAATIPKENNHVGAKTRPVSMGAGMQPATPAKEQAYAGPTFQASPAPSSLPVPKFFSRSVPNVAAQQQSLGARMAGQRTPETEQSSPESDAVLPTRETQSPLDVLFKADREEKQRSASMRSPEQYTKRTVPATEPRNPFQQQSKNIFLQELNGGVEMPSPKTIPPIRPSPPQRVRSSDSSAPLFQSDAEREAASRSLKDFLNINATPPNPPPPRANSNPRNDNSPFSTPSPFQRASSGPSTPVPSADQQYNYALHYGNRNLSPIFKAVRNDTPPSRPSGLRQQELASDVTPQLASPFSPPPPVQQQIDPNTFSRNFLDQQIRANAPPTVPPVHLSNGSHNQPTGSSSGPSSSILPQQSVAESSRGAAAPRAGDANGNSGTISGQQNNVNFEDNLRRMMKLNV